jgi:hypothetical protein
MMFVLGFTCGGIAAAAFMVVLIRLSTAPMELGEG